MTMPVRADDANGVATGAPGGMLPFRPIRAILVAAGHPPGWRIASTTR